MDPNPHIAAVTRDSDILGDRSRFICLDRNERVSPLTPAQFADLVARLRPGHLTAYPDLGPLYRRLSELTGLPIDRLSVGAGSDAIIRRAFHAFLRPGDAILTPDPSYAMYAVWARLFQARHLVVPYEADLSLDVERFIAMLAERPRIAVLANPDQPTGSVLPPDQLRRVVAAAHAADVLMLVDEAYYPFWPETAMGLVAEFDNLLVVRSFSKVGGIAGLRLGFGGGHPSIIRPIQTVRGSGEVSVMAALAGEWLLDHPEVSETFRQDAERGRQVLIAAAVRLGLGVVPTQGNFQLLRVPTGVSPATVVTALEQRGYLIKASFSADCIRDCIRVTIDGPEVMGPFIEVLAEVLAAGG